VPPGKSAARSAARASPSAGRCTPSRASAGW
jgi:hypothetical protein